MKKSLSILTLTALMLSVNVQAQMQNFNTKWVHKYRHTNTTGYSNDARKVIVDPTGVNLYTLSDVTSDFDLSGTQTSGTFHYVVLCKYDTVGNLLSSVAIDVGQHMANGFDLRSSFGLSLDGSGNVFIGYMSYDAASLYDVNVSKYSSSLNHLWTYKNNALSADEGISMQVSGAGVAYVLVKAISSTNTVRYKIIRANAQGTVSSAFFGINTNNIMLNSMALDNSNNLYMTGSQLLGVGGQHLLTMSVGIVGNNGVMRWSSVDSCLSLSGDDVGRHVIVGADGYIYVTGASQGPVNHGVDVVTVKYSAATGKRAWKNYINFTLSDGGFFLATADVNLVYVGWKGGNTAYVEEISTMSGQSFRRIAYAPTPIHNYTSLNGITLSEMKMSPGKNVYLSGTVHGEDNLDQFDAPFLIKVSFASRGAAKIELDIPVDGDFNSSRKSVSMALNNTKRTVYIVHSLAENHATHASESVEVAAYEGTLPFRQILPDNNDLQISLYPNPVIDQLTLVSQQENINCILYNAIGKEISALRIPASGKVMWDLSALPDGIYLLKINSPTGQEEVRKIVKN